MKRFGLVLLILMVVSCKRTESDTAVATSTDTVPAATAAPANTDTSTVPPGDLAFATTASMANLYEIESGRLALEKATGAAYKELAQTMVTQHTEIGDSYKPIAEKQGLPMPSTLEGEFKTLYDQLVATPGGTAFDAQYRQQMINTHTSAVSLFQNEATTGQDGELKAFAAQWLPTIQHHLEMAQALPPVR
jgi:putative membrane protein